MQTIRATDIERRHTRAQATSPSATASQRLRATSTARRLEQALAEVERLKRELAQARKGADVAPRSDERHEPGGAWTPWSPSASPRFDPVAVGSEPVPWSTIRIAKGKALYRAGDGFEALYAVRFGSCKAVLLSKNGHDQLVGHYMVGDVLGMDGIASGLHTCQTTALEDSEVFRLPLESIEQRARHDASFGQDFHRMLSTENARAQTLLVVLGSLRAEQRIAFFLLDLSQRYRSRGYSSREYVLRMSRQEIGSYLGLKLETVCRTLTRFHREGIVHISGRTIELRDWAALTRCADGE